MLFYVFDDEGAVVGAVLRSTATAEEVDVFVCPSTPRSSKTATIDATLLNERAPSIDRLFLLERVWTIEAHLEASF